MRSIRALRLLAVLAVATLTLVAAPACSTSAETGKGQALSARAFADAITKPGVTVIDVRTAGEFAAGHLINAINIDVESADFDQRVALLDTAASYALYCRSGNRSGVAMSRMLGAGFTDVVHLAGGIKAWSAAGMPVVAG